MNWSKGANNPAYLPSVNRVMGVGRTVAKFIVTNLKHIDLDQLIIVGHSLGAHAAGYGTIIYDKIFLKIYIHYSIFSREILTTKL